ncbi:MAG: DUF4157 domain-containing protein, partial [Chitinophagales bacterium]
PANIAAGGIQRKCADCEKEDKVQRKPLASFIQRKESASGAMASESLSNKINASRGGGQTLDSHTLSFMQSRFGTDFNNVKIHTGDESVQMNRELNAKAFTVGRDIYFNEGQYNPGSNEGKKLLAHELTHTVQQNTYRNLWSSIQRDLAVEPTTPAVIPPVLTAAQIRSAIVYNQHDFTEFDEIRLLRDVLGVSPDPTVIDEDFVNAVVIYQSNFGLPPDGKLGRGTAARLAVEITAEADFMGDPVKGTERRRIARRMHLREMVSQRAGTLAYRDFVGDHDRPSGMVSARIGGDEHTAFGTPQASNAITLEYTGEDSSRVRWLQFINIQMRGFQPSIAAPTFNTATVGATGAGTGTFTYSSATTTNWGVDSAHATIPFYDAAGISLSLANSSIIGDQPQGWQATANAFAATLTPAANRVVLTFNFDTYAVRDGTTPRYHIRWSATYEFDIVAGTESAIRYSRIGGGAINRLAAPHRGAIDLRYAGNGVL